jgi:hypothetical protein
MFSNVFYPKKPQEFVCENCNFLSCNKKDYNRHLQTIKHKKTFCQSFSVENTQKNPTAYICNCGKKYKDYSGLWRHKKTCNSEITENHTTEITVIESEHQKEEIAALKDIMKYLMKENSEMKTMMVEQQNTVLEIVKNGTTNNSHNTTHNNSHNKAFNLNFFLNETCKEAMNIGEFVDSLKIQLSDLENIGEAGYIEGISNIIVKNLKELDVTKRPVHCTDKKRETIYIKDADKWEKDENKTQMHKLIKRVVSKNTKMFAKFKEAHPDCLTYHSKYSEQYNKIIYESMGGKGDDDYEKNEKIIKNVLKEVVVDKNI